MMESRYLISSSVPICPICNSKVYLDTISDQYVCTHCTSRFDIEELYRDERTFVVRRHNNENNH